MVAATEARAHLIALQRRGLGVRAVADASDVPMATVKAVRSGKKLKLRAQTAARLLRVDEKAALDNTLVSAKGMRKDVEKLKKLGFTYREIAARIGSQAKIPVFHHKSSRVFVRTAFKVRKLLEAVERELQEEARIGFICPDCGESHEQSRRLEWLRAHRDAEPHEIRQEALCWWQGAYGQRLLRRDLKLLAEEPITRRRHE